MRNFWIVLIMTMPLLTMAQVKDTVRTAPPLPGGSSSGGVSFNVAAKQSVYIESLSSRFSSATPTVTVWYSTDSVDGPPTINSANGWVQLGTTSFTTSIGTVTKIPLADFGLAIPTGDTYGFFIEGPVIYTGTGSTPAGQYLFQDNAIRINTGVNVGFGGNAPSPAFTVRQFNGAVAYRLKDRVANDAGVVSIDSLGSACGNLTQDVYATVVNHGSNVIDSMNVILEVNGNVINTLKFTQALDTIGGVGQNSASVLVGSFNMQAAVPYAIKVYTSMPNGMQDMVPQNNMVSVQRQSSLSGNFTIGGTNSHFPTFMSAANALNTYGVCGPVVFNVQSGNYVEQVTLSNVAGVSATNFIKFIGAGRLATTLTHNGSGTAGTFVLNGTDHVTLSNMTIKTTGTSVSAAILLTNRADYFTVHDCSVIAPVTNTSSVVSFSASSSTAHPLNSGDNANHFTISESDITGGYYGVAALGMSSGRCAGHKIINSVFTDQNYYGIHLFYQDSILIEGNRITMGNQAANAAHGIYIFRTNDYKILANDLKVNQNGMTIQYADFFQTNTTRGKIINNMIRSNFGKALSLINTHQTDVYHNSVVGSPAMHISASTSSTMLDLRNNIFFSTSGLPFEAEQAGLVTNLDYNIYHTGGMSIAKVGSNTYTSLTAWQAASTSQNNNSLSGDPGFVSQDNLHVTGTLAHDAGVNSLGVGADFDGQPRPGAGSAIVDIGADEYEPNICPTVKSLTVSKIYNTTAQINWVQNPAANATGYKLEYGLQGFTPGGSGSSSFTLSPLSNAQALSNLLPETDYEVYMTVFCSVNDSSARMGPVPFRTICPTVVGQINESFETVTASGIPMCWEHGSGDFNWTQYSGPTPTTGTGPANALDGNHYMYVNAANPNSPQKVASLVSPAIDLSSITLPHAAFWYHMYSVNNDMGSLYVEMESPAGSGNWITQTIISGNKGDVWNYAFIDVLSVASQIVRFRFKAVTGFGELSDIAIDDFHVAPYVSSIAGQVENREQVKVYPNPTSDVLNVKWTSATLNDRGMSVSLIDAQGRVLRSEVIAAQQNQWSMGVDGIESGIYFLRIISDKQVIVKKFIKR